MRVLIIDDEEDTRSIFSMSLGLLGGAEVIEAESGPKGVEKAAEEKPDVIILDLLMPDMDGTATFLCLKDNPETTSIPVIFMTVKGMFSEFDALKNLGALAVIAKPFDPTTLTDQIKSILNANGYQHVTGNGAPLEAQANEEQKEEQKQEQKQKQEQNQLQEREQEELTGTVEATTECAPVEDALVKPPSIEPADATCAEPVPDDASPVSSASFSGAAHDQAHGYNKNNGSSNGRVSESTNVPRRPPDRKSLKRTTAAQKILGRLSGRLPGALKDGRLNKKRRQSS